MERLIKRFHALVQKTLKPAHKHRTTQSNNELPNRVGPVYFLMLTSTMQYSIATSTKIIPSNDVCDKYLYVFTKNNNYITIELKST